MLWVLSSEKYSGLQCIQHACEAISNLPALRRALKVSGCFEGKEDFDTRVLVSNTLELLYLRISSGTTFLTGIHPVF